MPSIVAQNRSRVKYVIVKFQNIRDKKVPKTSKENASTWKESGIRMPFDFSTATRKLESNKSGS